MASRPYFDASRGAWCIKWKSGPAKWVKTRLCPHPGWAKGDKPPKRPPPEAFRIARKYEDLEIKARHGVDVSEVRARPLAEFLADHESECEAAQTGGSMRVVRRTLKRFREWCAGRGVDTVPGVTVEVCRAYIAQRLRAVKWKTVHTERSILAPAWSRAFQAGTVPENPWIRTPIPGKPRHEEPPYWTREECDKIAGVCRPWLRDIFLVGINTGIRIAALLGLEWRDVDFNRGVVIVRAAASKSGRRYEVPMSEVCRSILERRTFDAGKDHTHVFVGERTGRRVRPSKAYRGLAAAAKRAGVPPKGKFNHIMRHTFISHAVMGGVPLSIVAQWAGHASVRMTEKYSHLCPSESHRRMEGFNLGGDPAPGA